MTFIANYNGDRIVSLDYSNNEWSILKENYRNNTLVCNDGKCGSDMIPKTYGPTGTQFFSHKSRGVACKYGRRESKEHLYLKEIIYKTAKKLGFHPEVEVYLANRIADVVVDDIVYEVQLSKQSEEKYRQRSKDYWNVGKEVYWIILKNPSDKYSCLPYPAVFLPERPGIDGQSMPTVAVQESSKMNPTIFDIDEWVACVLTQDFPWTSDCFVLFNLCKLFWQWWDFITEAIKEYPLGLVPKEAFKSAIKGRYSADFNSLTSSQLQEILDKIGSQPQEGILRFIYPKHEFYDDEYDLYKLSSNGWKTAKYAKKLYDDQSNKQKKRQYPPCSCTESNYTIGVFKYKNETYHLYRFCNRCGARSSQSIAKKKIPTSKFKSVCEWVDDKVNYKRTRNRPFG